MYTTWQRKPKTPFIGTKAPITRGVQRCAPIRPKMMAMTAPIWITRRLPTPVICIAPMFSCIHARALSAFQTGSLL